MEKTRRETEGKCFVDLGFARVESVNRMRKHCRDQILEAEPSEFQKKIGFSANLRILSEKCEFGPVLFVCWSPEKCQIRLQFLPYILLDVAKLGLVK